MKRGPYKIRNNGSCASMPITDDILDAIDRAVQYYGNVAQLAKLFDVAHSTVIFWRCKKTLSMSGKVWLEKVKPVLAPFLLDKGLVIREPAIGDYTYTPVTPADYKSDSRRRGGPTNSVSVIELALLRKYEPASESVSHYARVNACAKYTFSTKCKRGAFAIRINDEFPEFFPAGSNILAFPVSPRTGCMVMAKVRESGEVVVRRYERHGDFIKLVDCLGRPEFDIDWDTTKVSGKLVWMYPLIEVSMCLVPKGIRFNFEDEEED